MKAVIMAGGKGTRISSISADVPKPMIKINDKPVLQYQIECLKEQGITDYILTVSHLKEVIMDYFGDGKSLGVNISYYVEENPMGNAGALFKIREDLSEDFLLVNGDAVFNIDLKRFVDFHKAKNADVTLFAHPNNHPYDSGLLVTDSDEKVIEWITKETPRNHYYKNRVNAGIHIINPRVLDYIKKNLCDETGNMPQKVDLDRQILRPFVEMGNVYCYNSSEYVKDMGTPERYEQVTRDLQQGKVFARRLTNKQKAIFLDRDGTINKTVGFLSKEESFELLPQVADAIRKINDSDYLAIVITNQPVVARGEISEEGLQIIHNKMETLLGENGAYLDAIYYCPHHPDKGFEGEIKELKIHCDCRKPKPGLLIRAAKDFNIDLSKSWMIGDDIRDVGAGKNAGCKTILIGDKESGEDYLATSLYDAVSLVLGSL